MYFLRNLITFFLPGGLLLAAAFASLQHEDLSQWIIEITWVFPYILGIVAFLLGWRFNRSRLIFGVCVFLLCDQLLLYWGGSDDGNLLRAGFVGHCVVLLLPVNLFCIALWKERGIVTRRGLYRFLFILVQPLLAAALFNFKGAETVQWLDRFMPPIAMDGLNLPTYPALALYALAALTLLLRYRRYREQLDQGFFWALMTTLVALVIAEPGLFSSFYFSVASLILIIAALESAHSMAFRDELTGLPARRALNEALLKLHGTYTVAMLDIDFFKKFNDRYGHDVGDQVLAMVAAKLRQVGGGGKAFRYGGEEFTILFAGKGAEDAQPHLEKVRQAVAAAGFSIRGANRPAKKPKRGKKALASNKKVSVTISIGLAACTSDNSSPHGVVKAADKALYRAKNGGRNQVSL